MSKKIQLLLSRFFLLNIYFLCSHNEYKTQIKKGGFTVLVSLQTSNDHFVRGNWEEFQEKHLFSWVELSKSLLKAFGLRKGP